MGVIVSILLIALGVLSAEPMVSTKIPAAKGAIAKLQPYQDMLGFFGLSIGVVLLLEWLITLKYFYFANIFNVLIALAAILLISMLGVLSGVEYMRQNLKPSNPLVMKLEYMRAKLLPYQEKISTAGIAVGILYFLISL